MNDDGRRRFERRDVVPRRRCPRACPVSRHSDKTANDTIEIFMHVRRRREHCRRAGRHQQVSRHRPPDDVDRRANNSRVAHEPREPKRYLARYVRSAVREGWTVTRTAAAQERGNIVRAEFPTQTGSEIDESKAAADTQRIPELQKRNRRRSAVRKGQKREECPSHS